MIIEIIAIQGRASEENDHHAEIWITDGKEFAYVAHRIMLLHEDNIWNCIARGILRII
ncbi:hypothetical protein LCGC14_2402630 [marine sediment metagenome]|uniref:Uncharacterized protein n=1 Tax=marine sediment metagenome TaxID=412755 RepID=A0A0F9BV27_9ZZZZ